MFKLRVFVQPNASQSKIVGEHDHALKVALKAPAIEGKANKALIEFISAYCKVPKSNIQVIKGLQSRHKVVAINGLDDLCDELKAYGQTDKD